MVFGVKLRRIRCTETTRVDVEVGDIGGWIEKEENLSGNAWVSGDARVSGNAWVSGGKWEKSPLQIMTTRYFFNVCNFKDGEYEIKIGCQVHTIAWWLKHNEEHAKTTNDEDIAAEMRLYIELAAKLYGG